MLREQNATSITGTRLFSSWEEVEAVVVSYMDNYLPDFVAYYKSQGSPVGENRITDLLCSYLNICIDGFLPFWFGKNPTQVVGYRECDMGVFVKDKEMNPMLPIFEFEAKKLSPSSANKEYVCGKRGGIERFKRGIHSPHLPHCGMLGYLFIHDLHYWMEQINSWITDLAGQSPLSGVDWRGDDELLHTCGAVGNVVKFQSQNKRVGKSDILIFHYLMDLH